MSTIPPPIYFLPFAHSAMYIACTRQGFLSLLAPEIPSLFATSSNSVIGTLYSSNMFKLLSISFIVYSKRAPRAGFEPATPWLTAMCSATELPRNIGHKRPRLESNQPTRICSPLHNRSATRPVLKLSSFFAVESIPALYLI